MRALLAGAWLTLACSGSAAKDGLAALGARAGGAGELAGSAGVDVEPSAGAPAELGGFGGTASAGRASSTAGAAGLASAGGPMGGSAGTGSAGVPAAGAGRAGANAGGNGGQAGGGGSGGQPGGGMPSVGGAGAGGGSAGSLAGGGQGGSSTVDPLEPFPAPDCPGFTTYRIPINTCLLAAGHFAFADPVSFPDPSACADSGAPATCAYSENVGQCDPTSRGYVGGKACDGEYLLAYLKADGDGSLAASRHDDCSTYCQSQ